MPNMVVAPAYLGLMKKRVFAPPAKRASNISATSLPLVEREVSIHGFISFLDGTSTRA